MVYQKVRLIERSSLPLEEKIDLLLVYARQKPATEVGNIVDYSPIEHSSLINSHKKLFRRLNLPFCCVEADYPAGASLKTVEQQKPTKIHFSCIAASENYLDQLVRAVVAHDEIELGRCFGFPETAIQAYMGMREIGMTPLIGKPVDYFKSFIFSKDFYQEEFETSLRWHNAVKKLSPSLYAEITERTDYSPENFFPTWRYLDGNKLVFCI